MGLHDRFVEFYAVDGWYGIRMTFPDIRRAREKLHNAEKQARTALKAYRGE